MATTNNLPTRQQLEEIDALLKRMLSLPPLATETRDDPTSVTPTPTMPAPSMDTPVPETRIQSWRVEWPQQPQQPAATPTPMVTPPAPQPPTTPTPTLAAWGSPVNPTQQPAPILPHTPRFSVYAPPVNPGPEVPYASPPFSPAYPPGYAPNDYPKTAIPATLPGPAIITPQPPAKAVIVDSPHPLLYPLIILNWCFDVLTYLVPFGSWWRTIGKTILGRMGVLMLLVAAGWAAGEWYGIDWPKPDLAKLNLSRFGWAK